MQTKTTTNKEGKKGKMPQNIFVISQETDDIRNEETKSKLGTSCNPISTAFVSLCSCEAEQNVRQ